MFSRLAPALTAILPLAATLSTSVEAAQEAPVAVPVSIEDTAMLRLKSGSILWGSVVEHDEEGVRFRRLDNGGVVALSWSHLDPTEESELRLRFGYVESGVEEMMVDADRVFLIDGTELVGLIMERTQTEIWLKTSEGRLPIPLQRISGPSAVVQVPALDVYTKDELYQQKLMELSATLLSEGPEAAEAHFQVAQFCEALLDYEKALGHYEAVARIDPTYQAESMDAILSRTEEKAAVQAQVDTLQQIDLWRARKHYDKAVAELVLFPELYPDSPLMEDWNKLKDRVYKYQLRDLKKEVVRSWHYWTRRLAQTAARNMEYEEVLAYLDGQMAEDIILKVHEDMADIAPEIQPEEVRTLWQEREGGKIRQASYGNGTWLLGDAEARAGLEEKADTTAQKGSQDEARKQLEEKINRYLKNQQIAKKAAAGGNTEEEDPNAFWNTWPSANRNYWVLAYYVENSGDFNLTKVRFRNCRECGGTGTRDIVFTGGAVEGSVSGERVVPCPTCHHIGVVRMIKYR